MNENKPFCLCTPRLRLAALTVADAEALYRYRSLPEVTRFQGWAPTSVGEAVRFINEDISHIMDRPGTWFQLGIFLKDEPLLIGDVGIHFLDGQLEEHQNDPDIAGKDGGDAGIVEIGITVAPGFQGKGFAREAVGQVLDFLFNTLQKGKVVASVDPENHKSIALMEAAGLQLEGIHRKSVLFRGEWVDDAVFSVTREQWKNPLAPAL